MSQPDERRSGVIHDIGYRRYDGPRLGRVYAVRSLFGHSLRGAYGFGRPAKGKVLPFLLFVVMCLPALVSAALTAVTGSSPLIPYAGYAVSLQPVSAIFLAAQAPQMISLDLRFRVVPLYFSRPLTRSDYVLAKFAALTAALFILLAAPLVIMYVGGLFGKHDVVGETADFLPALGGALVFAVVLSGIGLAIAALTPRRGFGVAAIIAAYLISYAGVGVVQQILNTLHHPRAAGYAGLFTPYDLADGFQAWVLRTPHTPAGEAPSGSAGAVFVLGVVLVVAGSLATLFLRYRKVATS